MTFAVAADSYDRFMGRYSVLLSPQLADFAGVRDGQRVLDVGCGPGALTAELVRRLGARAVSAVDPSEPFVEAVRDRLPGVEVHQASAERLPFPEGRFDVALAQLVVHFMTDPVAGLGEMARVTADRGVVAACVWDHESGRTPLGTFWESARRLDPDVEGEWRLAGARAGHLGELLQEAGLDEVEETALAAEVEYASFDEWWEPFTLGVGPAGAHVVGLDEKKRARLRDLCLEQLPAPPFVISARAWAARGVV